MNTEELLYWLRWNHVPGVGSGRFFKLFEKYGSMKEAWNVSNSEIRGLIGEKAFRGWIEVQDWDPELELRKIQHQGFRICSYLSAEYPPLLKKIADPPPILYTWGEFQYGDDIAVAIVGTRNPSPQGAFTAKDLSTQLSYQGLTIVSGMARGIDSEAHRGALEAKGRTIAVLGCGLDQTYPPENSSLMREIADQGVVVTEFPLGTQPVPSNFPARNRIISGLSLGVVVVEAAQDSGSLITANFAVEQGREVFAVPGSINNDGSKGPHKLLKQGAKLVESYQDILTELSLPQLALEEIASAHNETVNGEEEKVLAVLSREPVHVDQILRRTLMSPAQLSSVLIQLEIKGAIKRFPGQLYLKVKF